MFSFDTSSLFIETAILCIVIACVLIKPIIIPDIVAFPWKEGEKEDKIVVLAGSYNPPHLGHLAMLEYLSQR